MFGRYLAVAVIAALAGIGVGKTDLFGDGMGYPPHRAETTVSADCGFASSAVTYSQPRDEEGRRGFAINRLERFDWDGGERASLAVPELPGAIGAMESPVIQLVVPSCLDEAGERLQTTIFYMTDGYDNAWPDMSSMEDVSLLYVDIRDDGSVRMTARELR